jgi:hypothetical protein
VLISLMQWGDRWLSRNGKPPVTLVDNASGQPLKRMAVQGKSGRALASRDVRFTAGPGATATTRTVIANRNRRVLGEA